MVLTRTIFLALNKKKFVKFGPLRTKLKALTLTYPKSTMRVRRMPMHLSSGHVTLMPGEFYPPSNFPQSDLGGRVDSCWALPQISSFA